MLSMPLSLEGRWGSLAGAQLSRPVLETWGNSSLGGCNCLEHSPLEPGTESPLWSSHRLLFQGGLHIHYWKRSCFGESHDLCGQLPASHVRFSPSPRESHDLDGKWPCNANVRCVCWRECVHAQAQPCLWLPVRGYAWRSAVWDEKSFTLVCCGGLIFLLQSQMLSSS